MNTKKLSIIIVLIFLCLGIMFQSYGVEKTIDQMMKEVSKEFEKDPTLQYTANPYRFIENNNAFSSILTQGIDIVPDLENYINNSPENGLREYLIAIAIEQITNTDLKGEDYGWTGPKTFKPAFDTHVKSIPEEVKRIVSLDVSKKEKTEKLKKLGTLAIPFIYDEYVDGEIIVEDSLIFLIESDLKIKNSLNKKELVILNKKSILKKGNDYAKIKKYIKNKSNN